MKLGFLTVILEELGFEDTVAFAAENGFSCVEVPCWPKGKAERRYAGVCHIDVEQLDAVEAERINAMLQKHGVEISALAYYPNALDADKQGAQLAIDHIKKVIDGAATLGVKTVNTFVGRDHRRNLEDNLVRFKEVWPSIIEQAEQKGVRIGIENCPMYFSNDEWPSGKNLAHSPAVWRRMFEIIPSASFGLNYDPSHFIWQHMDYIRPIREFKERIFHVHLKDVRLDRDRLDDVGILAIPLEYFTPKLPGLGDINWSAFFSALTDTDYTGPVVIEVEDRAFEGSLETRKGALIQTRNYMRQFLPV